MAFSARVSGGGGGCYDDVSIVLLSCMVESVLAFDTWLESTALRWALVEVIFEIINLKGRHSWNIYSPTDAIYFKLIN